MPFWVLFNTFMLNHININIIIFSHFLLYTHIKCIETNWQFCCCHVSRVGATNIDCCVVNIWLFCILITFKLTIFLELHVISLRKYCFWLRTKYAFFQPIWVVSRKDPAFGRQIIFWPMRIVVPIFIFLMLLPPKGLVKFSF